MVVGAVSKDLGVVSTAAVICRDGRSRSLHNAGDLLDIGFGYFSPNCLEAFSGILEGQKAENCSLEKKQTCNML